MFASDGHGSQDSAALGGRQQIIGDLLGQRFVLEQLIGRVPSRLRVTPALQGRRILATLRSQQHVHDGTDEHERRGEHIDPNAGDEGRGVVTHQLDPEPSNAVRGHIEREQPAVTEPVLAVDIEQEHEHQQVPQELVQESRVDDGRHLPGRHTVK